MSSRSGLNPREAFHRLASLQTSFAGVRSSRIHFSPTDGFPYDRVAQFNLEWMFSKLDSGFLVLDSGFQSPGFRIPRAKNSWIPESGFPYMGRKFNLAHLPVVGLRNVIKTSSNFASAFLVHVPKCRKLRVDWCFTSSLGGCKIFLGKFPNTSHLPIITLPLSELLIYLIIAVKISTGYQFTSREKLRAN